LTHQFDLVHSVAVLQHVPVRQGERIFRTLVSLVRPGGVGVINVPISASRLARSYSWTMAHVPLAYQAVNYLQRRPWDTPFMEMNVYRLNPLADILADHGVARLSVQLFTGPPGRFRYRAANLLFRIPD
jgi:2-polyprenyl-3-methyl-5-hydroxy-6-metoxy-1,4-benzoquinol methylase